MAWLQGEHSRWSSASDGVFGEGFTEAAVSQVLKVNRNIIHTPSSPVEMSSGIDCRIDFTGYILHQSKDWAQCFSVSSTLSMVFDINRVLADVTE